MDRRAHWEQVYRTRQFAELSWYTPHLSPSLELIQEISSPAAAVIDVGGGGSTLVDDLLDAGYRRLTVLDVSEIALAGVRSRLGPRADAVTWLHGDVTTAVLEEGTYDVWHDRAVFHFLTDAADRRAYVRTLTRALKAQGHVVIAAFSPDGPTRCSGLDVRQYDAAGLHRELGDGFVLSASEEWLHTAPNGARQAFVVCRFSRSSSPAG